MNAKIALEHIENGGCIFSIGQLEPDAVKELSKHVRAGKVARIKIRWPWHTYGICVKTAYCLPKHANHFQA